MYLLDTNHCSLIINNDREVIEKLKSISEEDVVVINTVILGELVFMA